MSNLSRPCWLCGSHIEPGNPTIYRSDVHQWECRRCTREIEQQSARGVTRVKSLPPSPEGAA
jgi:hypothetical protein